MPLFLVELTDGSAALVVRAACKACARRVAAESAREEGTLVWRDPEQCTVKPIEPDKGVNGVVLRRGVPK